MLSGKHLFPPLRMQRQADFCEIEVSPVYKVNLYFKKKKKWPEPKEWYLRIYVHVAEEWYQHMYVHMAKEG